MEGSSLSLMCWLVLSGVPCTTREWPRQRSVVFRGLLRDGTFDKPTTHKAWEEDGARLILGLAHWTLTMWDNPCTAMPCCCGVRFIETPSGFRHYSLATEEHMDCRNQSVSDHTLLLLGLVIAKLLIGTALRLYHQHNLGKTNSANEHRVFLLEQCNINGDWPSWRPC